MKKINTDLDSIRELSNGSVIGTRERTNVHSWRGIPYAKPPVGKLRWRAPQPVESWSGQIIADSYGSIAPQFAGLLAPVPKKLYGGIIGEEDCLTLNVFAPVWRVKQIPVGRELRPVMFWIHGGGNSAGTSASYDVLRNYADVDDIIVVSVNYRLGILGWFCHPSLAEADDSTIEERSGNFGTLDLICALKWLQDNISVFGGDPNKVTIFGESAGATNVLTLLASPLAEGLFHRAIIQSPVADTFSYGEATLANNHPLPSRRLSSAEIVRLLQVEENSSPEAGSQKARQKTETPEGLAKCLRSLSVAQLLSIFEPGSVGVYLTPRPIRDGVVLPKEPLAEVFASGNWNKVPVIIGSNRDEYRTFMADKPEYSRLLFGQLPILRNRQLYQEDSRYLSKAWRAVHVDGIAEAMIAGGHQDVWSYRFDWDEAPAIPFVRPDLLLGASHGMEMAFAFRDVAGEFDIFGVNTPFNKASRATVYRDMGDAWTSFARLGQPKLDNHRTWLRHGDSDDGGVSLIFDSPAEQGTRMEEVSESLGDLKNQVTQSPLLAPTARCRIFSRVFLWSPLFFSAEAESEYTQLCKKLDLQIDPSQFRPKLEI